MSGNCEPMDTVFRRRIRRGEKPRTPAVAADAGPARGRPGVDGAARRLNRPFLHGRPSVAASRPLGADTFCVGQLDHHLIGLDLDPGNVGVDEIRVSNLGRLIEVFLKKPVPQDQALDLGCRDTTDGSGPFRLALEQGRGQIVAVLDAAVADVARRYTNAAVIEDPSSQQGRGPHPCSLVTVHLSGQLGLDPVACRQSGDDQNSLCSA